MTRKTRVGSNAIYEDWKKRRGNSFSYELLPTLLRLSSINLMSFSCWRYREGRKGKMRIIKGNGTEFATGKNWNGLSPCRYSVGLKVSAQIVAGQPQLHYKSQTSDVTFDKLLNNINAGFDIERIP